MRILLYGMQSSGASVVAFTLAQKPHSLAFVDIWNMFAAPEIESTDRDIVAKVVVTSAFELDVHRRRFRPDVTLLVLRHPADTYDSLFGKPYANENGLMDEKFEIVEQVFRSGVGFDEILHYEDFAFCPGEVIGLFDRLGWKVGYEALTFRRTRQEIQDANIAGWPKIQERLKYGYGNIQTADVLRDRVRFAQPWGKSAHLPRICPSLFEHYSTMRAARGEAWHVPSQALLSCGLHAVLRELTESGTIPKRSERMGYRLDFPNVNSQCQITDHEVILAPSGRGRDTRLMVSGLPGWPFNRVRAVCFAKHPLAQGTIFQVGIEDTSGGTLVDKEYTLSHSSMRNIDIPFEAPASSISLALSARLADHSTSSAHSGISIQNLRLEQAAS